MPEQFIGSCTAALSNLISSDVIQSAQDPYKAFCEGIMNFHQHYCLNDHSSPWCHHEKVRKGGRGGSIQIDNSVNNIKVPSMASPVLLLQGPFAGYGHTSTGLRFQQGQANDQYCGGISWAGLGLQREEDRLGTHSLCMQDQHGHLPQGKRRLCP